MLSTRSVTLFLTFASIVFAGSLRAGDDVRQEEAFSLETMSLFRAWSETHGKEYDSHAERIQRLNVWLDNHGT